MRNQSVELRIEINLGLQSHGALHHLLHDGRSLWHHLVVRIYKRQVGTNFGQGTPQT